MNVFFLECTLISLNAPAKAGGPAHHTPEPEADHGVGGLDPAPPPGHGAEGTESAQTRSPRPQTHASA